MSSADQSEQLNQKVTSEYDMDPIIDGGDRLIGQRIDRYAILARLGGGAMAAVYRAVDQDSLQEVALKVLTSGADAVLRERFRVEARTVEKLEHPNIVHTIKVGESQSGLAYIAMELVEGSNLATLLDHQHQISVADSCALLEPIARALSYAHTHKIVHRDVKPSNILLRRVTPGTPHAITISALDYPVVPLLSDFGIARALDAPELTAVGRTIGTPAYMSPEQCAGQRLLDGRADIYSLGTVLYRSLVGRPPFVGSTTQILHAHVYEALTLPDNIARLLPPAILAILRYALQKNPDDRYADANLFATDLDALVRSIRGRHPAEHESTLTMPLLTATPLPYESTTAQVLVPGEGDQGIAPPVIPYVPPNAKGVGETPSSGNHRIAAPKTPTRKRIQTYPQNWAGIVGGALVALALVILGLIAVNTYLATPLNWPGSATPQSTSIAAIAAEVSATVTDTPSPTVDAGTPATPPASTVTVGASSDANLAPTSSRSAAQPSVAPSLPATQAAPGADPTLAATAVTTVTAVTITPTISLADNAATVTTTPTLTATPGITVYDARSTWEDILTYYQEQDWRRTRRFIIEMFATTLQINNEATASEIVGLSNTEQAERMVQYFFNQPQAPFWQQWQGAFSPAQVARVLFESYTALAAEENAADRPDLALDYLEAAQIIRPDTESFVTKLATATSNYRDADNSVAKTAAKQALASIYADYATALANIDSFCLAAVNLNVTVVFTAPVATTQPSPVEQTLKNYQMQCQPSAVTPEPTQFAGSIIYSTVESGHYRIYEVDLANAKFAPQLLVENGAQPAISPDGQQMAFFSTRQDSQGLSRYIFAEPNPYQLFPRFTKAVEDAKNGPPSWNVYGTEIVFSSKREGDRISRVFRVPAELQSDASLVDFGEDPAWQPIAGGVVVYKGADATGNNPGLWTMYENNQRSGRITNNVDDRRPAWSPDGQTLVFMRQLPGDNWEVFSKNLASQTELRLTNNSAKDGLPVVSPDGQWVAFASDRGGKWQIWVVPITGGEEQPLMPIQGVLEDWLEHAIQWVK